MKIVLKGIGTAEDAVRAYKEVRFPCSRSLGQNHRGRFFLSVCAWPLAPSPFTVGSPASIPVADIGTTHSTMFFAHGPDL
jgi:hypothetical protein